MIKKINEICNNNPAEIAPMPAAGASNRTAGAANATGPLLATDGREKAVSYSS